jgi:cell shape-determining protein MreC
MSKEEENKLVRWAKDNCPPINLNNEAPSLLRLINERKSLKEESRELREKLGMAIENLYDCAHTAVSHVAMANYESREQEAKRLIKTAYEQAQQTLSK